MWISWIAFISACLVAIVSVPILRSYKLPWLALFPYTAAWLLLAFSSFERAIG